MVIDKKIEIIRSKSEEVFRSLVEEWLKDHYCNQILDMQFHLIAKEYIVFIIYK